MSIVVSVPNIPFELMAKQFNDGFFGPLHIFLRLLWKFHDIHCNSLPRSYLKIIFWLATRTIRVALMVSCDLQNVFCIIWGEKTIKLRCIFRWSLANLIFLFLGWLSFDSMKAWAKCKWAFTLKDQHLTSNPFFLLLPIDQNGYYT